MSMLNRKINIVMYHYTRDLIHNRYPKIKGLDVSLFKKQLEFFKSKCNPITMEQLIESLNGGFEIPHNAVLFTFDDGYIDNYTYALPLLKDFGMQGSFFIPGKTFQTHQLLDVNKIHYILACADIDSLLKDVINRMDYYRGGEFEYEDTDILYNKYAVANRFDNEKIIFIKRMLQTVLPEKLRNIISSEVFKKYIGVSEEALAYELYMTPEQIGMLKREGMFIGIHGYDHYWLGNLSNDEMKKDIDLALAALSNYIDKNAWVINYPYGNYSDLVIDYVKTKGCIAGLTTEVRAANIDLENRYLLPRLDCNDFPPISENFKLIGGYNE